MHRNTIRAPAWAASLLEEPRPNRGALPSAEAVVDSLAHGSHSRMDIVAQRLVYCRAIQQRLESQLPGDAPSLGMPSHNRNGHVRSYTQFKEGNERYDSAWYPSEKLPAWRKQSMCARRSPGRARRSSKSRTRT